MWQKLHPPTLQPINRQNHTLKAVVTSQGLISFCVQGGWDKKDNLRKIVGKLLE